MKILQAVLAHKDFEWIDLSEEELKKYLVFTPNEIKTNIPHVHKYKELEGYDSRICSELSHLNYIRQQNDFDWVVINHYRRRLQVPNYNMQYVSRPIIFQITVKEQFKLFHNIEDLNLLTKIIMESDCPDDFKLEWIKSLEDTFFIPYNMVSVTGKVFNEWIDFGIKFIETYKTIKNIKTYEDMLKLNTDGDLKGKIHEKERVIGFLFERFSNAYWRWYSKKNNPLPDIKNPILYCDTKLLENGMVI